MFSPREKNPHGLHQRYRVEKLEGEADPNAAYFVMRLDNHGDDQVWLRHCREAAKTLAHNLIDDPDAAHLHQMAIELLAFIGQMEEGF